MVQAVSSDALPKDRRTIRLWAALGVVVLALLAAAGGALAVRQRSFQAELQQAREALYASRYQLARHDAGVQLACSRWTNDGEVLFLLGNSELLLGKREAAMAAWTRVPASSSFFGKAALAVATRLTDAGRYSPAEAILLEALADPTRDERHDPGAQKLILLVQSSRTIRRRAAERHSGASGAGPGTPQPSSGTSGPMISVPNLSASGRTRCRPPTKTTTVSGWAGPTTRSSPGVMTTRRAG